MLKASVKRISAGHQRAAGWRTDFLHVVTVELYSITGQLVNIGGWKI
jgi:hypothetical protein